MVDLNPYASRWKLADSLKNSAVEEWVDHHIHRPFAFLIIRPLQYRLTFITPIHLTVVAMLLGVAAGASFAYVPKHGGIGYFVGGLLIFLSVVFDCADGMLARLRGTSSRFGELADGYSDLVAGAAIWWGMSYAISSTMDQWWVWPVNILSLASIMFHLAIYDRFRGYYQACSHGQQREEMPSSSSSNSRIYGFLSGFYERGYGIFFALVGGRSAAAESLSPEAFAAHFHRSMKAISWIGLGTHLFLIYMLAIWASIINTNIYFIVHGAIIGLMNLAAVWALFRWKKAEARIASLE